MARTSFEAQLKKDLPAAEEAVKSILAEDGYKPVEYGSEMVWKKGTGMATAMHFIKTEFEGDTLHIWGWVQIGVASVGGKERELKGFTASIPKKSVLKTIKKIMAAV